MGRLYCAIHDTDKTRSIHLLRPNEPMAELNEDGWGIFWSVNLFAANRRLEALERLYAFYTEIDGIPKREQLSIIESNLQPSMIVESRAGYHVYWFCDESVKDVTRYTDAIRHRICPKMKGDKRATDVCRVLRVPGFNNIKDPENPFPVKLVEKNGRQFTLEEIEEAFPLVESKIKRFITKVNGSNLEIIQALSGTAAVKGEVFGFKEIYSGNVNLTVNGKNTHIFFPADEDVICAFPGRQSAFEFVNWYWDNKEKTLEEIRKVIPNFEITKGQA